MTLDEDQVSIDVVVPTLNSERTLDRCLSSVRRQTTKARLNLIVVDGGSSDKSQEIAVHHGATLYVNPGQYGTGLTGARYFGEIHGNSPFVWNIDSDNILVEDNVASALLRPLLANPSAMVSIPMTALDPSASGFSNWISLNEIEKVNGMKCKSENCGSWIFIQDMFYGLTNAALIRRSALAAAGGYDSDVRLLDRLRRLGMSGGAIVESAHFYHNQTTGPLDYRRKLVRRVLRFGRMTGDELRRYFVEYPPIAGSRHKYGTDVLAELVRTPIHAIPRSILRRDSRWLWGIVYPAIIGSVFISHPHASVKVQGSFL